MKEEEEEKMAKIMLVDDAAFMRMMIKKALSSSGYNDFIEAQDGAEAVKKNIEEKPDMELWILPCQKWTGYRLRKKFVKVIQMPKLLCVQQWERKVWL